MKIILAPDSFKGSLSSTEVALAMEQGVKRVLPGARCFKIPMADGGEGTVQALLDAAGGDLVQCRVKGPLGRRVAAGYGRLADGRTAVVEIAAAAGLALLSDKAKNPLKTTSYGAGELLRHALDRGAKKVIVGVGGSATNDGGAGLAQALGVVFRDARGRIIRQNGAGGMLRTIRAIDMTGAHPRLRAAQVLVACDVDNPLCGKRGASAVFGPQKGATPAMVKQLDRNLAHLADVIERDLGMKVGEVAGAGAAGGLGAGLLAFAGAELRSGIEIISKATSIERRLRHADLVITGEGRVDFQTAFGKTPAGIAALAGAYGVPVAAIGGSLADDAGEIFAHGINGLEAAIARDMSLGEALAHSREYVANAAERVLRLILIGRDMGQGGRTAARAKQAGSAAKKAGSASRAAGSAKKAGKGNAARAVGRVKKAGGSSAAHVAGGAKKAGSASRAAGSAKKSGTAGRAKKAGGSSAARVAGGVKKAGSAAARGKRAGSPAKKAGR